MKTVLVTGANKGIGLAVVEAILREQADCSVVLGSRSLQRGQQARDGLLEANESWGERIEVLELDVASDESVSEARTRFLERSDSAIAPLNGLVNNAGQAVGSLDDILNVNVHGIRRISAAFAPLMGSGARLANVTSAAGPNFVAQCDADRRAFFCDPDVTWPELQALMDQCVEIESSGWSSLGMHSTSRYGLSKACANTYTMLLAQQYPQLLVNACTPGFIETDLGLDFLGGRTPAEAGMKTPAEGARAIMSLLFEEPRGSGHYFGSDALRSPMDRYRAPGSPEFTGD